MTLPVRRHVLVDVDGVLADFDQGFLHVWRTAHPDRPWLPPAARRHFYLREDYPPAWRDAVQAVIDAPGFYRQLPVMAGAQAALAALAALRSNENVLVVSHGTMGRLFSTRWSDGTAPKWLPNCCLMEFAFDAGSHAFAYEGVWAPGDGGTDRWTWTDK